MAAKLAQALLLLVSVVVVTAAAAAAAAAAAVVAAADAEMVFSRLGRLPIDPRTSLFKCHRFQGIVASLI